MKPDFEKAAKERYPDLPYLPSYEEACYSRHRVQDKEIEAFLAGCEHAYSIDKETIERLEKENKRLQDWKYEMITLTTPLLDWGQSKESGIRPGHSIFEEALKRAKEYPELKEKIEDLLSAMYPPNEQQGI